MALTRRRLLATGGVAGVLAGAGWLGYAWYRPEPLFDLPDSGLRNPAVFSAPARSRDYNAVALFDPKRRVITFRYNLQPPGRPDQTWRGQEVEIPYDGPDGVFEIATSDGFVAPLFATTSPSEAHSENLVIIPDYTFQAYNRQGGGSFYTGADWISMTRPMSTTSYHSPGFNPIDFLGKEGFDHDLILQSEIYSMDWNIDKYKRIIIYGHDEYWTADIRLKLEDAVRGGANLINMSGNTGYWRIKRRDKLINRNIKGHFRNDEEIGAQWKLLGNGFRWAGFPISRHIDRLDLAEARQQLRETGFDFYDNDDEILDYTDFMRVINRDSALLRDVTVDDTGWITGEDPIMYIEMDGIPLTPTGDVDLEKTNGFEPDELEIAAEAWGTYAGDVTHFGFGLKSRFDHGGYVYSLSSIGWVQKLLNGHETIRQMTLNALA